MSRTLIAAALLMIASLRPAAAQLSSSNIKGTVTDSTGAMVPSVTVNATSKGTGFSRSSVANEAGQYTISDVPPGLYDVSVERAGFKKFTRTGVRLFVGQTAAVDVRLEVGQVTESVSVISDTPMIQESSSTVGTVIEGKMLTDIPLNGRNFLQLNLLSPGAIRSKNSNTFDAVAIDPTQQSFSVNGQKGDYNVYLLDGASIKEYQHGSNSMSPNVDAVQEFQVTTSNYSAAFGAEAGAQVNLVTKSGTNQFHGNVYEFLRNNKLDANNFFSLTKGAPPFKRNQFGGTFGGPIIIPKLYNGKDKTFFFVSGDFFREVKNIPQQGNYPTPAELAGNLSTLVGAAGPILDPVTRLPFPNNQIPQSRMPSTLLPFLQTGIGNGPWIPTPNSVVPGANFFFDDVRRYRGNQVIVRGDQKLGDGSFLYGRFAFNDGDRKNPNLNPNWFVGQKNRGQSASGHYSKTLSPRLLMDITLGFSRFTQNEPQSTAFKNDITNSILKINGMATLPDAWGAPVWSVTGFSNLGEVHYGPRGWKSEVFEWRPAFTMAKGKHNLRWGLDFKRHLENFDEIFRTNGNWSFDGRFSNYPLADFLLGLPASVNSSPDPFSPNTRYSEIAPYFQDDWKVTNNLTLNIGMRYEWVGIPRSSNKSISNLYFPPDGSSPKLVVSDGATAITYRGKQQALFNGVPYIQGGSVGLPPALVHNDNNNLAPRFGFAYRVPGTSSTVIRGGYGIFYQRDIQDKWVESSVNPPFVRSANTVLDLTNFQTFDWFNPTRGASAASAQVFANNTDFASGLLQAWNLTLERTVKGILVQGAYVGNKAQHLASMTTPNQAVPGPGAIKSRQRWQDWGTLYLAGYDGNSTYHSGQFKVQKPFSNGLTFLAAYTWSKALDDSGGTFVGEADRGGAFQNAYDRHSEKGLAGQDIRHRFVISYVYELPFGKGKAMLNKGGAASYVLGNWQINGITALQSGSPFTVTQSFNGANNDVGQRRPDAISDPNVLSSDRPRGEQVAKFFDTAAFRENRPADLVNGPYRFGTGGRHTVIGPGVMNWDFAIYKDFKIRESKRVQFRTEFFNIMNRPNFSNPGVTLGTAQFGRITATATDPRDIQFALKLYF